MGSQLNDLRNYSRQWLGEFIELYQTEECLWQPKHSDYANNVVRNVAYDKLIEKLKEVESNPDRNMVVRKINSLRSAFRRELRKINARPDYETRLWYYEKLSFFGDQGNPKRLILNSRSELKSNKRPLTLNFNDDSLEFEDHHLLETSSITPTSHIDLQEGTKESACVDVIIKNEDRKTQLHNEHMGDSERSHNIRDAAILNDHQHLHTETQPQHTAAVKVLEITSLDSNSQREIQQAVNSLEQHNLQQQFQQQHHQNAVQSTAAHLAQLNQQQVPTIQISREHLHHLFGGTATTYTTSSPTTPQRSIDEYDAIGVNVASKLRIMSGHQRIVAEKLISDVLFNGQLENLTVNSHLA